MDRRHIAAKLAVEFRADSARRFGGVGQVVLA
jgi:hypothetical protein